MSAAHDQICEKIALALTRRMVIDITTARAAVDEAVRRIGAHDLSVLGELDGLKPIADEYLHKTHVIKPRDRLHRLISRLADTYYDDLTDERIEQLERLADEWRWMHADASRFA